MKRPSLTKTALLFAVFAAAVIACVGLGAVTIPPGELFSPENRSILILRVCRVSMALIAGCGLSASGAALQAVLRNPLAEPYLLGTSSGAGLGAVAAIIAGVNGAALPFAALAGALASTWLVYRLASRGPRVPMHSLILSGVIVSIALSAVMLLVISVAPKEHLHSEIWWLWGSLNVYDIRLLAAAAALVIAGTAALWFFAKELNAISIGEEEAVHLGIDTERLKKLVFFLSSLITAAVICACGTIGFVGLIVPHAMRMLTGPDHRSLIPSSCLAGGVFLMLCDLAGRTVFSPMEIPIGVITAVAGAPIFMILLKTRERMR